MDRLYLMPITGVGTEADPRRPKYADSVISPSAWSMMDFGFEPVCLLWTNMADDSALVANGDVTALPANLDQNLTAGGVTATKAALEAMNVPAGWVTTALTYRQVVRVVCGVFMFFQRLNAVLGNVRVFGGGVTLDTTFGSLSAGVRAALASTANSLALDYSGVTGATTVRAMLKGMADQLSNVPVTIGAVSI